MILSALSGIVISPLMRVLAIVLAVVAAGAFGYVKGMERAEDRHAEFRAEVAVRAAEQEVKTAAKIEDQKRITQQVEEGYAKALDYLRARYDARRVRVQPGGGGLKVPAVPNPAQGSDATPADAEPAAGGASLEEACAVTTLQLIHLQEWIDQQDWIPKEGR